MIILRMFKILYDKKGTPVLYNPKIVAKWKLEEIEKFDFDITKPIEWKKFLSNYKTKNDKLLPSETPNGDDVVYMVFSWGRLPPSYTGVFPVQTGTIFFPGYDKAGNKRDVKLYGRIR